jgi:hypothetical protein
VSYAHRSSMSSQVHSHHYEARRVDSYIKRPITDSSETNSQLHQHFNRGSSAERSRNAEDTELLEEIDYDDEVECVDVRTPVNYSYKKFYITQYSRPNMSENVQTNRKTNAMPGWPSSTWKALRLCSKVRPQKSTI